MKTITPKFPKKLHGSFWGITTLFNIASYKNKYENYLRFRQSSKQQGLKLLAVEIAFFDRPFELKEGDAEILIQLRGDKKNILWQREAMLNIGLKNLPEDCDKFCWVDCDIIFKNDNWVNETSQLLEEYNVIQPFEWAIGLNKGVYNIDDLGKVPFGLYDGKKIYGKAYQVANLDKLTEFEGEGHSGFVWAFRRDVLRESMFYDKMILGSSEGDLMMARAFFAENIPDQFHLQYSDEARTHQRRWAEDIYKKVKGSVFYCSGNMLHLWHGRYKNRFYYGDNHLLKTFDIAKDLAYDSRGVLEWSSDKKRLHVAVRRHFFKRNEDGRFFIEIPLMFYKIYYTVFVLEKSVFFARKYNRLLGRLGRKIKGFSPATYIKLKRYFPDKIV